MHVRDASAGCQCAGGFSKCGENVLKEYDPETEVSSSKPVAFLRRHWLLIAIAVVAVGGGFLFLHRARQQSAANTRAQFNFRNNAVSVSIATVKQGDVVVRIPRFGYRHPRDHRSP